MCWSPTDMPGVDPSVIFHKLSILPKAKLVKQKPWKMNAERLRALNDKVDWLLKLDFILETLPRLARQFISGEEEK